MTETVHITLYEDELQCMEDGNIVEKDSDEGTFRFVRIGHHLDTEQLCVVGQYHIDGLRDGHTYNWNVEENRLRVSYGGERQNNTSATDLSVSINVDVDTSGAADELRRVADAFNDAADSLEEI